MINSQRWYYFKQNYWLAVESLESTGEFDIKCEYCGWIGERWSPTNRFKYYCLDHIIPWHKLYLHNEDFLYDVRNIAICCNECNKKKGGKYLSGDLSDYICERQESLAPECGLK